MIGDRYLLRFAQRLSLERDSTNRRTVAAYGITIIAVLLLGIFFVLPRLSLETQAVARRSGIHAIGGEDWRVLYGDPSSETSNDLSNDKAGGPPEALWRSEFRRGGDHASRVQALAGKTFWLGTKISRETALTALRQGASVFQIGSLYGTYDVFLDGARVAHGDSSVARDLVVVTIPPEKLETGFALAIRLVHDMGDPFPDTLYYSGLMKASDALTLKRQADYEWLVTTMWSGGFNFALGLLFLALWLCAPRKQELAAFAAFGFLHATAQVSLSPLVWANVDGLTFHRFNFIVFCYESIVILSLGFALGRVRGSGSFVFLAAAFAAPWLVFFTDAQSMDLFLLSVETARVLNPLAYVLSALICFSQARLLTIGVGGASLTDSGRIPKLHFAWISMLAMCLIHLWGAHASVDVRFYNAIFLVVFAAMVVHDFRRLDVLVRRAPLSRYHQLAVLPQSIPCVMIAIDLKKSERLFQFELEKRTGARFVQETIAGFHASVEAAGGEVIQAEGDSILFFFERGGPLAPTGAPAKRTSAQPTEHFDVLAAVSLVRELAWTLSSKLKDAERQHGGVFPTEIGLRAALGTGEIRPILQTMNGRELAAWAQAGPTNVLLEVARLLEAEAKVALPGESLLVFKEDEDAPQGWGIEVSRSAIVPIKHGREMRIGALELRREQPLAPFKREA